MNTLARETSTAQIDVARGVDPHQDTHTAAVGSHRSRDHEGALCASGPFVSDHRPGQGG